MNYTEKMRSVKSFFNMNYHKNKIFLTISITACLTLSLVTISFLPTAALAQENPPPTIIPQQYRFVDPESEVLEGEKVHTGDKPILSVISERIRYVPGQNVIIMGMVYDRDGEVTKAKVDLIVKHITEDKTNEKIVYQQSVLSRGILGFVDDGLNLIDIGMYEVTATININGQEESSFTQFIVRDYAFTNAAYLMYLGIAAFVGLMVLIGSRMTHHVSIREVLRFVFISLIAFTPAAVFVLTDVEIGQNAPLGLVVVPKFPDDASLDDIVAGNVPLIGKEWMINFGGNWHTYYISGIQIPVFVFLFGIAGGYIRYLYKTWREFVKPKPLSKIIGNKELEQLEENILIYISVPKKSQQRKMADAAQEESMGGSELNKSLEELRHSVRMAVLHRSMMDLALLFLAPLLAFASYFILLQSGITANDFPTIAAVSFGVGLGTDAIVDRLGNIGLGNKDTKDSSSKKKDTKDSSSKKKDTKDSSSKKKDE